ncbi:MAG: hypothetical protein LKK19_05645 [Bacteroidales bacterium]|nr:hypothetical protein [Bacteroidales bacterium]MCI2122168.1 hypothetical protein [Bacteroidales bacterium]MCI2144688.1 hypothetical protein [Bacteroidales bacterium]
MTKYSFIVYHEDEDAFLEQLREIGLIDITRKARAFDDASRIIFDDSRRYKEAERNLKLIAKQNAGSEIPKCDCADSELLSETEKLLGEKNSLETSLLAASSSLKNAEAWGDFHSEDLEKLDGMGLDVHSYSIKDADFDKGNFGSKYPVTILNRCNGRCYFIITVPKGSNYTFPHSEVPMPAQPEHEVTADMAEMEEKRKTVNSKLLALTSKIDILEEQRSEKMKGFDIYAAIHGSQKAADGSLLLFEGFAPTDDDISVQKALDATGAYYEHRPAIAKDNPPIKLKNNGFASLFEPIGNMYMLPRYDELDLTPFFAPFYMLFFGLCLGDMGYGLVLMLIGALVAIKVPKYRGIGKLVILLGLGSFIMPALNGTMFGTKVYTIFPALEKFSGNLLTDIQMFWFSIIFGLVQIIFGRLINAIYSMIHHGWRTGMANIGWVLVIIWCAVAYSGSQTGHSMRSPAFDYIFGIGGLALIVLFSKVTGNIFARIGKGVVSLYDITGIFGDMLSYIRLFGLGTSGGILGMVVNSMALQLSHIPYVGWGLTVILLILGHSLVIALCCLGAFVHPMRLTFVEFYKNAGFTGGGKTYRPLLK